MPRKSILNEVEIAVLVALNGKTGGALSAHFSEEAIVATFRSDLRGRIKEALDSLARNPNGFVYIKPTRGGRTYGIAPNGVNKLRELKLA